MTLTPEQKLAARRELTTTTCGACGAAKKRGQVFCRGCYWRLPAAAQRGLYQSAYSDAYAGAYVAALEALAGRAEAPEEAPEGATGKLF